VDRALIQTWRAEAVALLEVNQRARSFAATVSVVLYLTIAADVVACVLAHDSTPLCVLPLLVLGLLSLLFQLYADLTVIGTAREALERLLEARLGEPVLIYESVIAPIRKEPPLVFSVRILQTLYALTAVGAIVAGVLAAFRGHSVGVELLVCTATVLGATSAALSYRDMLRSAPVTARRIRHANL
jgi:hypothetical protein